jgi:hypothetical protein
MAARLVTAEIPVTAEFALPTASRPPVAVPLLATIPKLVVVAAVLAHTPKSSAKSWNSLSLTSNQRNSAGAGRRAVFKKRCGSRGGVI